MPESPEIAHFDDDTTAIEEGAFAGSATLHEVVFPQHLQSIGNGAFYACKLLKKIDLQSGVVSIGDDAFSNCSNLSLVTLGNNLKYIGHFAFAATAIKHFAFPPSIEDFGDFLFAYCRSLVSVDIPVAIEYLSGSLFRGCTALQSINVEKGNAKLKSLSGVLYSADERVLIYAPNQAVGTQYVIPYGVEQIDDSAFADCELLESLTIPPTVVEIGLSALRRCKNLREIRTDDDGLFVNRNGMLCSASDTRLVVVPPRTDIKHINLPSSITTIDEGALAYNQTVEKISINSTIVTLSNRFAYKDIALTEVYLPQCIEVIGSAAFTGCKSLKTCDLPTNITTIMHHAFAGCVNLPAPFFPDGLVTIEDSAYSECTSFENIEFPDSLEYIGNEAFMGCENLQNVDFSANLKQIGNGAFSMCDLRQVVIPDSVMKIGNYAFAECENLEFVSLPNHIDVPEDAFYGCENLKTISKRNPADK